MCMQFNSLHHEVSYLFYSNPTYQECDILACQGKWHRRGKKKPTPQGHNTNFQEHQRIFCSLKLLGNLFFFFFLALISLQRWGGMSHTFHDKQKTSFARRANLIAAPHLLTFFSPPPSSSLFIMSISNFNFQFSPSSSQFATKLFPGWGADCRTTGCKRVSRRDESFPLISIMQNVNV